MKTVDCRGLNCPVPVLKTKTAMAGHPKDNLEVIVDNETARENVLRLARNQGREASWKTKGRFFFISISGKGTENEEASVLTADIDKVSKPVLFITTEELGRGSSKLGRLLMRNFIYTLTQSETLPWALVLMNSGVKLSIENSQVIEELTELQSKGVQILVCGTCLDYFQIKEQHSAGQVSNMYDIADLLLSSERVISF